MGLIELQSFGSADELARFVARQWVEQLSEGCADTIYPVALSGGRIAPDFFRGIVVAAQKKNLSFKNVHFFWADERCVAPDHAESNYRIAKELLFEPLGIAGENIHRILGELREQHAVAQAEAEICRICPLDSSGQPLLEMAFLGMGEDGHIASLFPQEPQAMTLDETVYRAVLATKPPPNRITLGYRPLIVARRAWVLVSGANKAGPLRAAMTPGSDLPIGRLLKFRAQTHIFAAV